MCGIFGIVDLDLGQGNGQPIDEERFRRALEMLHHRGPDGQRVARVDTGVMFGHARLSIIDLSDDSSQPMPLEDRYWLTYNGEIFNYLELRAELETLGVTFQTSGDVEVLLQAYARWGPACVTRFNGMWAFAIWDKQEKSLFASRDRFGIKPFNYAVVDGQLLFASEIKALLAYHPTLAEPDYNMIGNFCRTSVGAQHEQTWFQRVKRLMPATNMVVRDGALDRQRYWNYPTEKQIDISFDDARDHYRALFLDSVRLRMRSDVAVGVALSGGVDSNSIVYSMQEIAARGQPCVTSRAWPVGQIGPDSLPVMRGHESVDESVVSRGVATELGLPIEVVDTDYSDVVGQLSAIIWHLESGNAAPAVLPLVQMYRRARESMTVIMDGQGADELLGGYIESIFASAQLDLIKAGNIRGFVQAVVAYRKTHRLRTSAMMAVRNASDDVPAITALQQKWSGLDAIYGPLLRKEYRRLPDSPDVPHGADEESLQNVLRRQHSGVLVDLLHYGDAISMANGLEARMPFLDHRLVDFAWSLPGDYKVRRGIGKVIHREAMRGLVPPHIIDDAVKRGFPTPISRALRKPYNGGKDALSVILSERSLARGLFDRTGVTSIIAEHRAGKRDHGTLLFRLLMTELWFRTFIDAR